jgi:subtilisin family serine protease
MKNNAHSGGRLPKTTTSFIVSIVLTGMAWYALPLPLSAAGTDSAPPELPKRVIVKFKPGLAQEVEKALPASLELASPDKTVRPEWFRAHGVKGLKPLYKQCVRQKKERGVGFAQLVDEVRGRFAGRSRRAQPGNETPDLSRTYILELSAVSEPGLTAEIARLNADPEVEYAQRELVATAEFTPNDPFYSSTGTWGQTYADLWGLQEIQSGTAWDSTIGQGIVVAVVDTGVDFTHPDLAGNIWTNAAEIAGNGIDDDGNGFVDDTIGWDFVGASYQNPTPDNNPVDVHGHGTHVAGIIAAAGNNGLGVVGVAWGARIMAVRGLDNNGIGTDAELANAVTYAANNGADVINNSYGGTGYSQTLKDAMDYAHSLGVVLVVAAGNSTVRAETFFPACYPNVITVAAGATSDGRTSFSNFGSKIDVAAPGEDILSLRAAGTSLGSIVATNYTRLSGTSMASPHVAGEAALVLALQPALTPEQVRQAVRVSADDRIWPGFDPYFGWGRVNAANALLVTNPLEAKIQSPLEGAAVNGPVSFSGVAQGPGFSSYTLDYGLGEPASTWTVIQTGSSSVNGGVLGTGELNLPDGRNSVRLRAFDNLGRVFTDEMSVQVQYCAITNPASGPTPNAAPAFKPGVVVPLAGTVRGPSFAQYHVQWTRGLTASGVWSDTGVTLINGGLSPVTNDVFAVFDTSVLPAPDYYIIRLLVDNSGFTSDVRTMMYIQPDLVSTNWPQMIWSTPTPWSGMVPARDTNGNIRLFMSVAPDAATPNQAKLLGFTGDGSSSVSVPLASSNNGFQPAAADLNGDGADEVIVGDGGSVRIVRPDLTSYTITPAESVTFQYSRIVVDDLNNDGSPEIIALGDDVTHSRGYLYAWKPNGQLLSPHFPISLVDSNAFQRENSPVRFLTVDLNGDGLKEILVVDSPTWTNCVLRAFNWDGTPYAWPAVAFSNHVSTMVAGDMDNDGSIDIAVSYFNNYSHEYWAVLSADGSLKPGWPQTTYPVLSDGARMALADLNRDGHRELVLSAIHKLYVWNVDGTLFSPVWPLQCWDATCLAVADADGDGYPEILSFQEDWNSQFAYDDCKLQAFRRDGSMWKFWRLSGQAGIGSSRYYAVAAGDFRRTGVVDLAAWYALGSSGYGQTMVLSQNTPFSASGMDWPLTYHDAANTCVVPVAVSGAPSVQLTSPVDGATLSGLVSVSAVASDDVGVVGVQFKLDGVNLGSEVTTAPYSLTWDTHPAANGTHSLSAVARDSDGHATATALTVTVANDVTPPSVSISSPTNNARVGGVISVSANATDDFGVAGVQFRLDNLNFGPVLTNPPYAVSWDTTTGTNATHTWAAVAWDAAGNTRTSAVVTVTVTNVIRINFQPATAPTYPGYAVDSGAVYGPQTNGYSYGWNANNSANAFDRNSSLSQDQRYDTLITMQTGGTFTWEIGVPNGRYSVHVVAGDASNFNSTYKINVENVLVVNGNPKNNARWVEGTSTITLSDGRLTVSNASGAKLNKVCFLEITPVP